MIRIAIIDDNPSERLVLRLLMEENGYSVVAEGGDGDEALRICKEEVPDIVIMDIGLPNKDGIEATIEIAAQCMVPVVLLTGRDDEETVKRAMTSGAMAYMIKPVVESTLVAAIELAISRYAEFLGLKKENAKLKDALETRKMVERAKGILMQRDDISEDEAYARLRKISMDRRTSMKAVAEIVLGSAGVD
jgi:response regulator NasT